MKVFVAGASGAIGMRLVPQLIAAGHEVTAMTRSEQKTGRLRAFGATAVAADALDRNQVMQAVMRAEPEVMIHQLTGLADVKSLRNFDREFVLTNRLRTEGTDHLLEGARAAGTRRFIAQSHGNWSYERTGTGLKTEEDPLDPDPPANQVKSLEAIRYLEQGIREADGIEAIALRYANFYGPGTGFALGGDIVSQVRKRKLPIIGDGGGVWSFVHVDDAAAATIAAIEHGSPGIYNVVDDEPAPVSAWLRALAEAVGAKPPRHVPAWLGRLAAGEVGVSMMTQIRGTSNAKAKRELVWSPRSAATDRASKTASAMSRSRALNRSPCPCEALDQPPAIPAATPTDRRAIAFAVTCSRPAFAYPPKGRSSEGIPIALAATSMAGCRAEVSARGSVELGPGDAIVHSEMVREIVAITDPTATVCGFGRRRLASPLADANRQGQREGH